MKSTVILSALLVTVFSLPSQAAYHRFWLGYQRPELAKPEFEKQLSANFIPLTAALAKVGLIAYQPVLPKRLSPEIPDEIALVSYESKDAYDSYRATDAGKAYGEAHWKIFDQTRSHSLVPEMFKGKIETGKAYDLRPQFMKYVSSFAVMNIYTKPVRPEPQTNYALSAAYRERPISTWINTVVAVQPGIVIEYLIYTKRPNAAELAKHTQQFSDIFENIQTIYLYREYPKNLSMTEGDGVSVLVDKDAD